MRVTEELDATPLPSPDAGAHVYDLGQNMVGHARVTLTGEAGETVRIRVAEVLNPDGTLYTANFRSAKATDYYTFATDGPETWEPKFTFHGFRYVEITGVDEAPAGRRDHRRRRRHRRRPGLARDLVGAGQPAAEQHRLGPARQLPVDPDRHARA